MARPRTATVQLEARGSFVRHPERKRERANEPKPTGELGEPPTGIGKDEAKVWRELSGKLPPGIAFNSDQASFEVLVCLVANFRLRRKLKMPQVVGELSQMNKLFTQFGMTPADRSRVSASQPAKPKNDPWDKLMSRNPQ